MTAVARPGGAALEDGAVTAPFATRPIPSPGSLNVDWEERWNVERMRAYRLGRARSALAASDLGAVLLFDFNNIRYTTSTHIGEWARDKMTRYALLTRGGDPHIWDFGSAAKHHRLNCPWLPQENVHAGMIGLRGAVAPDAGLFRARGPRDCRDPAHRGRRRHAARRRHRRAADGGRPGRRGDRRARRAAGHARRARGQVRRRDHPAQHGLRDGRRGIPVHLGAPQAGRPRERARRGGHEGPVRSRVGARRQHQRGLGRALQPPPARVQRPDHPARRPGLLRHHPHVRRLQDVLLPHVRGRARARTRSATRTSRRASGSTRRSS